MKERPILMSGPMVIATLDGRKTKTRRVIVPQRTDDAGWLYHDRGRKVYAVRQGMTGLPMRALLDVCPYGQPGDRLWVRETWMPRMDGQTELHYGEAIYRATLGLAELLPSGRKWRPSIFMPRWASRITLEVVSVRVERVQEISEADAIAEGVTVTPGHASRPIGSSDPRQPYTHRQAFGALWDSINAKRGYGWATNPWVWVIEFRRIV